MIGFLIRIIPVNRNPAEIRTLTMFLRQRLTRPRWAFLIRIIVHSPSDQRTRENAIGKQRSDAWSGEWEHYQKGLNRSLSSFRHDIYTVPWIDLSVLRQFPDFLQVRTLSPGLSFLQPVCQSFLCHWRQNAYNQSEIPRRFFISCEDSMSSSLSRRRSSAMR